MGQAVRSHRVQFYDDGVFLAAQVASFLAEAITHDGAAAAVARPSHLALIDEQLRARGVDVETMRITGRLVLADAEIMLAASWPDRPARFTSMARWWTCCGRRTAARKRSSSSGCGRS
jgi:hypothetical protein